MKWMSGSTKRQCDQALSPPSRSAVPPRPAPPAVSRFRGTRRAPRADSPSAGGHRESSRRKTKRGPGAPVLGGVHAGPGAAREFGHGQAERVAAGELARCLLRLGFGRIVVSAIEVSNMLVNLVYKVDECDRALVAPPPAARRGRGRARTAPGSRTSPRPAPRT